MPAPDGEYELERQGKHCVSIYFRTDLHAEHVSAARTARIASTHGQHFREGPLGNAGIRGFPAAVLLPRHQ